MLQLEEERRHQSWMMQEAEAAHKRTVTALEESLSTTQNNFKGTYTPLQSPAIPSSSFTLSFHSPLLTSSFSSLPPHPHPHSSHLHSLTPFPSSSLVEAEQELERMVRELPTFPVTKAVLAGYSRAHLFTSLTTTLQAPGGIYRKETSPSLRSSEADHSAATTPVDGSADLEGPPAILPTEGSEDSTQLSVGNHSVLSVQVSPCTNYRSVLNSDYIECL